MAGTASQREMIVKKLYYLLIPAPLQELNDVLENKSFALQGNAAKELWGAVFGLQPNRVSQSALVELTEDYLGLTQAMRTMRCSAFIACPHSKLGIRTSEVCQSVRARTHAHTHTQPGDSLVKPAKDQIEENQHFFRRLALAAHRGEAHKRPLNQILEPATSLKCNPLSVKVLSQCLYTAHKSMVHILVFGKQASPKECLYTAQRFTVHILAYPSWHKNCRVHYKNLWVSIESSALVDHRGKGKSVLVWHGHLARRWPLEAQNAFLSWKKGAGFSSPKKRMVTSACEYAMSLMFATVMASSLESASITWRGKICGQHVQGLRK
eukprot:1156195-Pelagomonas_calceolata.AAC.3